MAEVEKHSPVNNHETIDEVDEEHLNDTYSPSWKEQAQKVAVRLSSTWIGQLVIRQGDRLLWSLEKTAKWSCPQEKG